MPIAVAMTPTMTICWTVRLRSRRGVLSSGMPAASYGSSATERNDGTYPPLRGDAGRRLRRAEGRSREPSPKPSIGPRERKVEGEEPWWRRKALANCAGWR